MMVPTADGGTRMPEAVRAPLLGVPPLPLVAPKAK